MVLNRLGEPLTSKHVWERPSKRPLSSFMSSSKMDCGGLCWLQTGINEEDGDIAGYK